MTASSVESVSLPPIGAEPESNASGLPVFRQLGVALGILVIVFGATYVGTIATLVRPTTSAQDVTVEQQLSLTAESKTIRNEFDGAIVAGTSAFVWDVTAQRALFNKDADEQLPIASITKLMTALVAYELLNADDRVNITTKAIRELGDSGFRDGESFTFKDLLDLTLISSSNDGAVALSEAAGSSVELDEAPLSVFLRAMNIKAEELGLTQTYFESVTGLDLSEHEAGAYSSARDVAFLMEHIITHYPDVLALTKIDMTTVNNEDGEYHLVKNTNEIVNEIDGLIASKTGYTELAGGNLVVAFEAGFNRPIIVVVLGSTRSGRFDDVLNLVERAKRQVGVTTR